MKSRSDSNRRVHSFAAAALLALGGLAAVPAFAGQAHVAGLQDGRTYRQLIVKFVAGSAPARHAAAVDASLRRAGLGLVSGKSTPVLTRLRRMAIGSDVVASDVPLSRAQTQALIRRIADDPNVEWVQADLPVDITALPNDPRFAEQWDLADSAVGIRAPSAWATSDGSGAVVAVVDTGIVSHPDLNGNVIAGYDMLSVSDGNGRDPNPTDTVYAPSLPHGTHVAGTVAAVTGNGVGVAGVAPGVKIVPVRVLGQGSNSFMSDLADGIVWASGGRVAGVPANPNPADVINLSVGTPTACSQTPAWQAAINTATANGTIVAAAAGNNNIDVRGFTPASCNNVITVAASDQGSRRAWYSGYGAGIDITAPGGESCSPSTEFLPLGRFVNKPQECTRQHLTQGILSTYSGSRYEYLDGTSMATPHVAGVIAMIQAAAPTPRTFEQVRQILATTARPISAANCPGGCGAGLVDAAAAVARARSATP
ncbi:S8 family serine peptidase [Lysobacter capsici]|uniref:S8 family serine peptidase n=1 Tax=Lysobacter capsici TaxID=435897 RepID=UPI001C00877A|nr:S8 family serine peptidase [Lysobacter capsici]QWF15822.1 S8 family serine peptidase [Lysobacter capsici]